MGRRYRAHCCASGWRAPAVLQRERPRPAAAAAPVDRAVTSCRARGPSGLAARAPVGDPLLRVASLVSGLDRGAAATTRPARAAVHPRLLAAPGHARGDHAEPLLVRLEEPLGQADERGDVGDL